MQSNTNITTSQLSPETIEAISKIQKLIRAQYASDKFKIATDIELRDITNTNMLKLYARLKECRDLPEQIRAQITQEKRHANDALTPLEHKLYSKLLNKPLLLNHATPTPDLINQSGYLYSTRMLSAKGINVRTHTASCLNQDYYVFFSYGYSPDVKTVRFLGQSDVFVFNFDEFARKEPERLAGTWSSGHFYAYAQQQFSEPIIYKFNNDTTRVNALYKIKHSPFPEFVHQYEFHTGDSVVRQTVRFEDEVIAGSDIKSWHALRLIEFIRFLSPKIRDAILTSWDNDKLIDQLFDTIFSPGSAEMHIPQVMACAKEYTNYVPREKSASDLYEINDYLTAATSGVDILRKLLSKNKSILTAKYTQGKHKGLSLLNIAVQKNDIASVRLLLELNSVVNEPYINTAQSGTWYYATRTALQDAIEAKNVAMIHLLCDTEIDNASPQVSITYRARVSLLDMYTAIANHVDQDLFIYLLQHYQYQQEELNLLLFLSSYYNNVMAIKVLLKTGANPNATCAIRQTEDNAHLIPPSLHGTALTVAAECGHFGAAEILLASLATDSNACVQEDYLLYKEGRGKSPLIAAIKGALTINDPHNSNNDFSVQIDEKRYGKTDTRNINNYCEIVKQLIAKGGDLLYTAGNGESVLNMLHDQIKNGKPLPSELEKIYHQLLNDKTLSALEQKANQAKNTQHFYHKSYAIITALNKDNELVVLLGNTKQNGTHWTSPGGHIDYIHDRDGADAAIQLAARQIGLDLNQAEKRDAVTRYVETLSYQKANSDTNEKENQIDERTIEIHHFHLKKRAQEQRFHKSLNATSAHRAHTVSVFNETHFVKLTDLKLSLITFQGVVLPIYYYQNRPVSYKISVKLAEMQDIKGVDFDQAYRLATKLSVRWDATLDDAILAGDLASIKLLSTSFINQHSRSTILLKAIQHHQNEIATFLLNNDIVLTSSDFYQLFYKLNTPQPIYSEELLLLLHEKHRTLSFVYLAKYAGHHGCKKLIEKFSADKELLNKALNGAITACNIEAFDAICALWQANYDRKELTKSIQDTIDYKEWDSFKTTEACKLVLAFTHHLISKNYSQVINAILFNRGVQALHEMVKGDLDQKRVSSDGTLAILEEDINQFALLIHNDPQSTLLFDTNRDYVAQYYRVLDTTENLYSIYKAMKKIPQYQALAEKYRCMVTAQPVLALSFAIQERNTTDIDRIILNHHTDPTLQHYIKHGAPSFVGLQDDAGDDLLQRAVKHNSIEVVKFIIDKEKYSKAYNFSFDLCDRDYRSPLANARRLGFTEIANLLKAEGAQDIVPEHEKNKPETIAAPFEMHAKWINEETYLQPFKSSYSLKKWNLYELPVERISHGAQHACRVAILSRIFLNFYRALGNQEALAMSEEDIKLLQIAALCHDAMRENDGVDYYEQQSADFCENYLKSMGVNNEKAHYFANAIVERDKTLIGRIIQSADCIDITRCLSLFYINRMSAYQDADANYRCELSTMVKEVMALQEKQYDTKCDVTAILEGTDVIIATAKKTRNANRYELKQSYEQDRQLLQKIQDELKDYPTLSFYYHDPKVFNVQHTESEKAKWTDVKQTAFYTSPMISQAGQDGWQLYCYKDQLSAMRSLMWIKEQIGKDYPDLQKFGRVIHTPNYAETPYRFRLSKAQHEKLQTVLASDNIQTQRMQETVNLSQNHPSPFWQQKSNDQPSVSVQSEVPLQIKSPFPTS